MTTPANRPNAPGAVGALVTGILGLIICAPIGIAGIVLGNKAKREIAASGGAYGGSGMATAGLVLGWLAIVLWALGAIIYILAR